jgi:hypothetical protein
MTYCLQNHWLARKIESRQAKQVGKKKTKEKKVQYIGLLEEITLLGTL